MTTTAVVIAILAVVILGLSVWSLRQLAPWGVPRRRPVVEPLDLSSFEDQDVVEKIVQWREQGLPVWMHLKRGTFYVVIMRAHVDRPLEEGDVWAGPFGSAEVQCSKPLGPSDLVILYKGTDGRRWCRPHGEFFDGRFIQVSPYQGRDWDAPRPAGEGDPAIPPPPPPSRRADGRSRSARWPSNWW